MSISYIGTGKLAGNNEELVGFLKKQIRYARRIDITPGTRTKLVHLISEVDFSLEAGNLTLVWQKSDDANPMIRQSLAEGNNPIPSSSYQYISANKNADIKLPWHESIIALPYLMPTVLFDGYTAVSNSQTQAGLKFWEKLYTRENYASFARLNPSAMTIFFTPDFDDIDRYDNDIIAGTTHNVFMTTEMFSDYVKLSERLYHHVSNHLNVVVNSLSKTAPWAYGLNLFALSSGGNLKLMPYIPIARKIWTRGHTAIDVSPTSISFNSYNHNMFILDNKMYISYVQDVEVQCDSYVPFHNGTGYKAYPTMEFNDGVFEFNYDAFVIPRFYETYSNVIRKEFQIRTPVLAQYNLTVTGDNLKIELEKATALHSLWPQVYKGLYDSDPQLPGGVSVRDLPFVQKAWDQQFGYGHAPITQGKYQQVVDYQYIPVQGFFPRNHQNVEALLASELDPDTGILGCVSVVPWDTTEFDSSSRLIFTAFDINNDIPEIPDGYVEIPFSDEGVVQLSMTHYNGKFYLGVSRKPGLTSSLIEIEVTSLNPVQAIVTRQIQHGGCNRVVVQAVKDGEML